MDDMSVSQIENEEKTLVDVFRWSETKFKKIDTSMMEIKESLLSLQQRTNNAATTVNQMMGEMRQSFDEIKKDQKMCRKISGKKRITKSNYVG